MPEEQDLGRLRHKSNFTVRSMSLRPVWRPGNMGMQLHDPSAQLTNWIPLLVPPRLERRQAMVCE
jgi:hypothetical protein